MVIDDEETIRIMAKGMMGDDYDVTVVGSGREALKLFFDGYGCDLVLLDLNMPDMDGWETYTEVRAISNLHHVPIAIFSSSEDPKDKEKAQKMGAVDFIQKPLNKIQMLERVGRLINKG